MEPDTLNVLGVYLVAIFAFFFAGCACCGSACCGGFASADGTIVIVNLTSRAICSTPQCDTLEGTYVVTEVAPASWYAVNGGTTGDYCAQFELTGLGGTTQCVKERVVALVRSDSDPTKCWVDVLVLNHLLLAIYFGTAFVATGSLCAAINMGNGVLGGGPLCRDVNTVTQPTTIDFTC